jgi:hypothetical protein
LAIRKKLVEEVKTINFSIFYQRQYGIKEMHRILKPNQQERPYNPLLLQRKNQSRMTEGNVSFKTHTQHLSQTQSQTPSQTPSQTMCLPSKQHKTRVKHDRQHKVTDNNSRKRVNSKELVDSPEIGDEKRKHNHTNGTGNAEQEGKAKLLDDSGHLFEESGVLGFFGGSAPVHVDADEMGDKSLGYVEGQAAEEDRHEWDPHQIGEE